LAAQFTVPTPEAITNWAHRVLAAKNSLTEPDARRVEGAFQSKLTTLGNDDAAMTTPQSPIIDPALQSLPPKPHTAEPTERLAPRGIDKSALALPEPRRIRDKNHVRFVAQQACLVCGRNPSDPHHIRSAQHPALGRKVSDEFTVPLCRGHHREVHRCGNEPTWWNTVGLDPTIAARAL
jgi:hypothetical protein